MVATKFSLNLLKTETINSVNFVAGWLFSFAIFNKVFTECYWSGVFTAKLFEISLLSCGKIDDKGYLLFKFHFFSLCNCGFILIVVYIHWFFQAVAAITINRHFKSQLDPVLFQFHYVQPVFVLPLFFLVIMPNSELPYCQNALAVMVLLSQKIIVNKSCETK